MNELKAVNGWSEYKLTVLKQLEYLAEEVKLVRAALARIEEQAATRATDLAAEHSAWRIESSAEWARHQGREESARRTWGAVVVVISVLINLFAVVLAFVVVL